MSIDRACTSVPPLNIDIGDHGVLKANDIRGRSGDELQDYAFSMNNPRRRSNSFSAGHTLADFKTKFEHIDPEPVFEEDTMGAPKEGSITTDDDHSHDGHSLKEVDTSDTSVSADSVADEESVMKK
jgi:hypothetical protein